MREEPPSRPLSDEDRALLDLLLSVPFPGRDELRAQIAVAEYFDDCGNDHGCIGFRYPGGADLPVVPDEAGAIPIEAAGRGSDGNLVHVFIHVNRGRADYTEVYTPGNEPISRPILETLRRVDYVPDHDHPGVGSLVARSVTLIDERGS